MVCLAIQFMSISGPPVLPMIPQWFILPFARLLFPAWTSPTAACRSPRHPGRMHLPGPVLLLISGTTLQLAGAGPKEPSCRCAEADTGALPELWREAPIFHLQISQHSARVGGDHSSVAQRSRDVAKVMQQAVAEPEIDSRWPDSRSSALLPATADCEATSALSLHPLPQRRGSPDVHSAAQTRALVGEEAYDSRYTYAARSSAGVS